MNFKRNFYTLVMIGALPLALSGLAGCGRMAMDEGSGTDMNEAMESTSAPMGHDMADMDLGPKDEFFDLRFIDGMMPHHQGAIAMAEAALANSNRAEIKQLAQDIIAAQEAEIAQMQAWRQDWYPDAGPEPMMYHAEMGHMMPMTAEMQSAMMMDVDLGGADDQFDARFLAAMIPHHAGALGMAEQALERSDRPEIKQLSEAILSSQQAEIDKMQQWQQEWYGQ